jgi:hypothetical protein
MNLIGTRRMWAGFAKPMEAEAARPTVAETIRMKADGELLTREPEMIAQMGSVTM